MHDTELANPPTMEEILQTIRGIIAGKVDNVTDANKEGVLELTEMMDTSGKVVSLKSNEAPKTSDILFDIDNALGGSNSPQSADQFTDFSGGRHISLDDVDDMFGDDISSASEPTAKSLSAGDELFDNSSPGPVKAPEPEKSVEAKKPELRVEQKTLEEVMGKNVSPEEDKKSTTSRLVSEQVASETATALKMLVNTVHKPASDGLSFRSGNTLEDLVVELLKPELSKWLEANLPSIVKNVVEKEVKKLIPKDDD